MRILKVRFKGLKQATAHADKQGGDHRVHKEDSHGVRRLPLGKRNPDNPVSKKAKELVKTLPPSKPLKDLGKMDELKYKIKPEAMTDQFKCRKCFSRSCSYYEVQTRSADEPMTQFITCLNCKNRWKQ